MGKQQSGPNAAGTGSSDSEEEELGRSSAFRGKAQHPQQQPQQQLQQQIVPPSIDQQEKPPPAADYSSRPGKKRRKRLHGHMGPADNPAQAEDR